MSILHDAFPAHAGSAVFQAAGDPKEVRLGRSENPNLRLPELGGPQTSQGNGRFAPEAALRSALLYPRGLTVAQAFVLEKRGQVARRTSEKSPAKAGRKVKRRNAAMS